jgi:hypothetical protein
MHRGTNWKSANNVVTREKVTHETGFGNCLQPLARLGVAPLRSHYSVGARHIEARIADASKAFVNVDRQLLSGR